MRFLAAPLPQIDSRYLLLDFPIDEARISATPASAIEPRALLSLRSAGDMRFTPIDRSDNRGSLFNLVGYDPDRVLGGRLAHSREVLFPRSREEYSQLACSAESRQGGADGIVLGDRSLASVITAADCMPIWILDRSLGLFGVLHSGWKGTGILARALDGLISRGSLGAEHVSIILGPAIGSCCYSVPEERARFFASEYGARAGFLSADGSWRVDLREANISIARSRGIGALLSIDECTACDSRFGSYRREGPADFTCMAASCGFFKGKSQTLETEVLA